MKTLIALCSLSTGLIACGGGGGSSPPGTQPIPNPPANPTAPATPADPKPPVVVPPTVAACPASAAAQPQIMFDKTPMLAICDGVHVEPSAPAEDQLALRQSVASAYTTVTSFYNTFTAPHPQMIFCQTQTCRTYFMGGYAGVYSPLGLQLAGATYTAGKPTIFITYTSFVGQAHSNTTSHELTHTETLYRYEGPASTGVPAWFNEGIATLVGGYPDCTTLTVNYISDLRTVDGADALMTASAGGKGDAIYCQASREISAWIAINGKQKFFDLLSGVQAGQRFYSLYGKFVTH